MALMQPEETLRT